MLILLNSGIISTGSAYPQNKEIGLLECLAWCTTHGLSPTDCAIPALFQKGLCYECGPRKKIASEELCDKRCLDTSSDPSNCGACGNQVSQADVYSISTLQY